MVQVVRDGFPLKRPMQGGIFMIMCSVSIACSVFADGGSQIADDIRGQDSPLIDHIQYGGDQDESGPHLMVFLADGSTRDDGRDVACDIVWPAIRRGTPPDRFIFTVLDESGDIALATDMTECNP